MTKKQCIIISIISAIVSGIFMYLVTYFPYEFAEVMFWLVSFAFCFGCFYLLIAIIWTKGEILPNPYPTIYAFDPDIEEKLKQIEDIEKKKENRK